MRREGKAGKERDAGVRARFVGLRQKLLEGTAGRKVENTEWGPGSRAGVPGRESRHPHPWRPHAHLALRFGSTSPGKERRA